VFKVWFCFFFSASIMFCQTLHVGLMQVTHSISPGFVLSSIVIVKLCPKSFCVCQKLRTKFVLPSYSSLNSCEFFS
jgi:hypothetical protein